MPEVLIECSFCRCPCSTEGPPEARIARCAGCGREFAPSTAGEIASPGPGPAAASVPSPEPPARAHSGWGTLPEKIGRFLIRERLGAGASGAVYRAMDPKLEREVALKVPHREVQQDPIARERFFREARAAARLNHPHIVPVYEAGTDGETSYLACAFIPGRTLDDALDDGPFEPRRAARIVAAMADALHAAHREGIVHRDVKPSNILLDVDDQPRLVDFGLARLGAGGACLTLVGLILGTPAYLAPEQARGRSNEAAAPSDQYSLGATFYELLCGRVPFSGPIEIVIFHTIHTPPPPPRAERPDIPAELEAICLRALAKRPEDRFPSCRHLADELRRWEAALNAPLTAPAPPPPSGVSPRPSSPAPEEAHHRPRRASAVAAIAVVLALAGSAAVRMGRDDPPLRPAPEQAVDGPSPPPMPVELPADTARADSPPPIPARGADDPVTDLPPDVFAGPLSPAVELALAGPVPRTVGATSPEAPPAIRPPEADTAPVELEFIPTARDLELRGGHLVLKDVEDEVSRGIPPLKRQRDSYQAAIRRGDVQERDLAVGREARSLLIERREAVKRAIDEHIRRASSALKSDAVVKKAYGDLKAQLTELEAQIDRFPTPEAIDQQLRRLKQALEGQLAAFAARAAAVRATVDQTRRAYDRLADDPEVIARLEDAGRASKKPIRLGPSPGFRSDVEVLELIEKSLSGDDDPAARKARRRSPAPARPVKGRPGSALRGGRSDTAID